MRVISGLAKGRRLFPPKSKAIRPALDQVKEAIFNILFDVEGCCVLDLFAGTGSMGIEALSRGAAEAVFADSAKEAIQLIGKNIDACGFANRSTVLAMTAVRAISVLSSHGKQFDLIFVDPPYEKFFVKKTLKQLARSSLLYEKTIIVVEHHPKEPISDSFGLALTDCRKYGQTLITFLQKQET